MIHIRSLLPALLLGAASLSNAQSLFPLKEGGRWFGDSTLVLKKIPNEPPDTLLVRAFKITPQGDTIQNPNAYYWLDDFQLEQLPANTPVYNPGTLEIYQGDTPQEPIPQRITPPKAIINKQSSLDLSA